MHWPRSCRQVLLATLALVVVAPSSAHAQSIPGKFEITPYGAYRFGGTISDEGLEQDAEFDDAASAGLILNLRESAHTQWELIYSRQTTDADVSDFAFASPDMEVDIQSLQLGGTYIAPERVLRPYARPYLAATIGGTRIAPDVAGLDSDSFWSFSVGGGLRLFPTERIGVRVEARLWGTLLDTDSDLFCVSDAQGGLCAIALDSRMLWQVETFAGLTFRF